MQEFTHLADACIAETQVQKLSLPQSSLLGTFGINAPVEKWSANDIMLVQIHVAWYKQRVRPSLHDGDQYLLTEALPLDGNGEWAVVWYAAKDEAWDKSLVVHLCRDE
jgi:hypothetical protein